MSSALLNAARRSCRRSLPSTTSARSSSLPTPPAATTARQNWNSPLCLHLQENVHVQSQARAHSTTAAPDEADTNSTGSNNNKRQPFVTDEIEPGEWDAELKDPLHRPKYKSRARIISKEDYAHQPSVSFEDQYATFSDAMVTLSWMDHETQRRVYDLYLNWMTTAQEKHGKTSHEYVCRLLGQRFNITPFRAAAIIQLQHLEEQYKLNEPDRLILTEEAKIMDDYMKHTIEEAYRSTGETPPETFVEQVDPEGGMESYKTMAVDDLMDVDQLTRDANVREQERARLMINEHVYIEDKDDEAQEIKLTRETKRLIKQKEQLQAKNEAAADAVASPTAKQAMDQKEERRPRWKFVAQTINTQDLNPKAKFSHYKDGKPLRGRRHRTRFQQDWPENTLVEQDGELRPANLAEVKQTSWKPVRHVQEFTYEGLKKGWLDRTVRNKSNAWGKKPILEEKIEEEEKPEAAEGEELEAATESSDSSSSDTEGGSSSSDGDSDDTKAVGDDEEKIEKEENPEAAEGEELEVTTETSDSSSSDSEGSSSSSDDDSESDDDSGDTKAVEGEDNKEPETIEESKEEKDK